MKILNLFVLFLLFGCENIIRAKIPFSFTATPPPTTTPPGNTFDWTWTPASSMSELRYGSQSITLNDGRLFVAGGWDFATARNSFQVYDPASGTWSAEGVMTTGRIGPSSILLPDGKVLIIGGMTSAVLQSCEIYDPATHTTTSTGAMAYGRNVPGVDLLNDGQVMVIGGYGFQLEYIRKC